MKALQFHINVPKFVAAKALRIFFGKQVFFKGPVKTVRLAEIPEPQTLSPDWVKIKTLYCGFCGSDLNLILLHDSPSASPFTSFPCVIGHEIVGEVVDVKNRIPGIQTGDIVTINPILACQSRGIHPMCQPCRAGRPGNCENFAEGSLPPGMFLGINRGVNGGFAPYLTAHKSQLHKIPEGLPLKSAVMTEPVAVALQTVFDNMPKNDEQVLVIGGGVIGNLIIQSIRVLVPHCRISLIEPSSFAAALATRAGADDVIDSNEVYSQAARITGAKSYKPMLGKQIHMGGFNRVYDTVGISATLNLAMRLMRAMGTLSVVGIGGNARLDLTPLWLKLQTIKGVYAYGIVELNHQKQDVFDLAIEWMNTGKIQADALVTHTFSLNDYEQMIAVNLDKQKHQAMKTVVTFR